MSEILDSLSIIKPKPSPLPLIRIGGDRDGAYLVPDDLDGIVACFSPGVNNFKFFEDELTLNYRIKCHLCDYSSDMEKFKTPLIAGMQTFNKKWLDINGDENSISLADWVTELESNPAEDLMLQMDIEGAEYRNLIHCPDSILSRFRIIVLELHQLEMFKDIGSSFQENLYPLLQKLGQLFICVHAHPNNCCGEFLLPEFGLNVPNIIELTFLRNDRFSNRDNLFAPQLPHPLDIRANVPSKYPLFLNEQWLPDGMRSSESTIKMLEDQLNYYESKNIDHLENNLKLANESITTLHSICLNVAQKLYGYDYNRVNLQDTYNISKGKNFLLSSSYGNYPTQGIVIDKAPFFFHTNFGVNQFITIDLGSLHEMTLLVIHNRSDICLERARCLFYVIHDSIQFDFLAGLPISITPEFLTLKQAKCVTPLMRMRGRYISIFSPEYTALHLESIAIFGKLDRNV